MTAIPTTFGTGGSGVAPAGSSTPTLADTLRDAADDFAELRTELLKCGAIFTDLINIRPCLVALTAKLDSDTGVADTDYAASCDPTALSTTANPNPAAMATTKA